MNTLILPIVGTVIRDSASRHKMFQSMLYYLIYSHYGIPSEVTENAISHIKRLEESIRRNGRIMGFKRKIKILTQTLRQMGFKNIHMGKIGYLWTLSYFYNPPLIDIGILHALKHLHRAGVNISIVAETTNLPEGAMRRLLQHLELPLDHTFILEDGDPSTENPMSFKKVLRNIHNINPEKLVGIAKDVPIARAMIHAGISNVALISAEGGETILKSLTRPEDIMRFVLGSAKI
jgi:hypothetical protein